MDDVEGKKVEGTQPFGPYEFTHQWTNLEAKSYTIRFQYMVHFFINPSNLPTHTCSQTDIVVVPSSGAGKFRNTNFILYIYIYNNLTLYLHHFFLYYKLYSCFLCLCPNTNTKNMCGK